MPLPVRSVPVWQRASALCLAAMLGMLLAGCTRPPGAPPTPSPHPTQSANAVPVLPALAGAAAPADEINDLASRGRDVVLVGSLDDGRQRPVFRFSDDFGATWAVGAVTNPAAGPFIGESASLVAVQPRGDWLAIGQDATAHRAAMWRSTDGRAWQRTLLATTQIDPQTDELVDLIAVRDGFVLLGNRTTPGRSTIQAAWHSTDGRSWRIGRIPGDGSVMSAAVSGDVVVAVGSRDDEVSRIWVSRNFGRSWQNATIPTSASISQAGHYLTEVTSWGHGFRAIGSHWLNEWQPFVLSSKDGATWTYAASTGRIPGPAKIPRLGTAITAADGVGLAGIEKDLQHTEVALSWFDGVNWSPSRLPKGDERLVKEHVTGLAALGSDRLAVITKELGSNNVSEVWRSTKLGRSFVRTTLPSVPSAQPKTVATSIARYQNGLAMVGSSGGLPVIWRTAADGSIGAAHALSDDVRDRVSGVVAGGPQLLVVGERSIGNDTDAAVWIGEGVFRRSPTYTFQAQSMYASSSIVSARWIHGRWYLVGERQGDGPGSSSALVASSTDGARWTFGRAASTVRKHASGDVDDLRAGSDGTRLMTAVVDTPSGVVAAGLTAYGAGHPPAIWHRRGGDRWKLSTIAVPGFETGQIYHLEARGRILIASGFVWRKGQSYGTARLWRSTDSGRTWQVVRFDSDIMALRTTASDDRFLITRFDQRTQRPLAWTSTDGLNWSALDLAALNIPTDAAADIADAVIDHHDVVALVQVTTAERDETRLVRLPIPQ